MRGSSVIPQIGQFPGALRTISGCMGHVYSTASGSSAIPHLGHGPDLCSRTSGSIGQTYETLAAVPLIGTVSGAASPFDVTYFAGSVLKRSRHRGLQKKYVLRSCSAEPRA